MRSATALLLSIAALIFADQAEGFGDEYTMPCGASSVEDFYSHIDHLGRGYNIFKGNPLRSVGQMDPGMKLPVFDINEYKECKRTADHAKIIPDHVYAQTALQCEHQRTSKELTTAEEYQDEMKHGVSLHGDVPFKTFSAAFTASAEYETVQTNIVDKEISYIVAESSCVLYTANLLDTHHDLDKNFKISARKLLKKLQAQEDGKKHAFKEEHVFDFIETFGTHYLLHVTMGGKYGQVTGIDKSKVTKEESSHTGWEAGAELKLTEVLSRGFKVTGSEDKKNKEVFEKATTTKSEYSYGSKPPVDGDSSQWMDQDLNVVPISYVLEDIHKAITPRNLLIDPAKNEAYEKNKENKQTVKKLQKIIEKYIKGGKYCQTLKEKGQIKSCAAPERDSLETCRFCKSCGGEFDAEGGAYVRYSYTKNSENYAPFDLQAFGDKCEGELTTHSIVPTIQSVGGVRTEWFNRISKIQLCCTRKYKCRACEKCSSDYPVSVGAIPYVDRVYFARSMNAMNEEEVFSHIQGYDSECQGEIGFGNAPEKLCCQEAMKHDKGGVCEMHGPSRGLAPGYVKASGPMFMYMDRTIEMQCPAATTKA